MKKPVFPPWSSNPSLPMPLPVARSVDIMRQDIRGTLKILSRAGLETGRRKRLTRRIRRNSRIYGRV